MKKLLVQIFPCTLLILVVTQSNAQDYQRFVSMMPNTSEVSKKIIADNIYTTYVKQAGALEQLRMILKSIDGNRTNPLSNEEKRIDNEYSKVYNQLISKAQLPDKEVYGYLTNERVKLLTRYSMNRSFRDDLYQLFFDEDFKNNVEPLVQEQLLYGNRTIEEIQIDTEKHREEKGKERQEEITKMWLSNLLKFKYKFFGIVIIALGAFLLIQVNKIGHSISRNQFERRNASGIEEFDSYDDMVKRKRSEGMQGCMGQIILIFGGLLITIGLFLLFI